MKLVTFFTRFFLIGFIAAGLSACPESMVKPATNSPLQQAYAVKDELIIAKKALNDLYAQEKARRVSHPESKQLISDGTYDIAWNTAEDATAIVNNLIAQARAGVLATDLKADVEKKIDEIDAVTGRKE